MGSQRFHLPNGEGYIEYSVEDIEHDYANIIVESAEKHSPVGIGYILREEIVVRIMLDEDSTSTAKRWFAYDAGICSGVPGSRIGNINAGYATMECAIQALLSEYASMTNDVRTDDYEEGSVEYDECVGYDYEPIEVDIWHETGRDGSLSPEICAKIREAGGIHVLASRLMCDMIQEVARLLWLHHDLLRRDGDDVRVFVSVDAPTDICGERFIDRNKPFDGMTLNVTLCPSMQSVALPGSVVISVVDIENASDENVLVGTSVVNGRNANHGSIDESLSIGLSVDSFASKATEKDSVETFANRTMSTFFDTLMRCMVMEYQSRMDGWREIPQEETELGYGFSMISPEPMQMPNGGTARLLEYA